MITDHLADYLKEAEAAADEIAELREKIHRCPEPGKNEVKTAALIEGYLGSLGIETERVTDTAVVGLLRGKGTPAGGNGPVKRKTAALRADMDALPLTENTGADFASEVPGMMHACGHDVHTAAALGAANLLAAHADELNGDVVFMFEPDEEGEGRARELIEHGCLDDAGAVFGAHVSPDIPDGKIGVRYGKFYAGADVFDITFHGRSAHGADRSKGADALAAAAEASTKILALQDRGDNSGEGALSADVPEEKCVITIGTFESGTARNIIADRAKITGMARTLGTSDRALLKQLICRIAEESAEAYGATVEIDYVPSYPGVTNDDAMTRFAEDTAKELLGESNVERIEEPLMMTEDFGYYIDKVPGTFYHIGAGSTYPLHSDKFLPTRKALLTAAAMHAAVITRFLSE